MDVGAKKKNVYGGSENKERGLHLSTKGVRICNGFSRSIRLNGSVWWT